VPSHSCCNLLEVPADYVYVEQIFPLFAAMGAALGICGFAIARNIAINPDVRSVSYPSLSVSSECFSALH